MTAPRAAAARPSGPDPVSFRAEVLAWYDLHRRRLPFRATTDPYLVLVSETILQQTQVSRGGPAWEAFSARFPTVQALAAATPAEVLRAWRGLGYNRRALNLHRAARIVADELGGRFPDDVAGLARLPGVGPYTARAVAAIAYGQPVGAVDTNVRRVLGRVVTGDPAGLRAKDLQAIADRLVPADRSADWTHALMDLGSTVCRPRTPRCESCPVRTVCRLPMLATGPGVRAGARAAAPVGGARQGHDARLPFERSSRWLRGRLVDRLREAAGSSWTVIDGPIGSHDVRAVAVALASLAREGLVELDAGDGPSRARLPIA